LQKVDEMDMGVDPRTRSHGAIFYHPAGAVAFCPLNHMISSVLRKLVCAGYSVYP
jgi:hypothetical protein